MSKSKWASGSISDTARKRHERLEKATKSDTYPKAPSKVGSGRSADAQAIRTRQDYEKIPEGNVRRPGIGQVFRGRARKD